MVVSRGGHRPVSGQSLLLGQQVGDRLVDQEGDHGVNRHLSHVERQQNRQNHRGHSLVGHVRVNRRDNQVAHQRHHDGQHRTHQNADGGTLARTDLTVDERGKIGLSIKQLQEKKPEEKKQTASSYRPAPRRAPANDFRRPNRFNNNAASFEDKLSKFLKDSDERLTDLRKKTDSKRGGRGGGSRRSE